MKRSDNRVENISKEVLNMKEKIFAITLLALIWLPVKSAYAAGTASGTVISNTATATYGVGTITGLTATGSTTITVDNKINLTVTKNADATVTPGSTDNALIFVVRNDGNTTQRYALSATNSAGIVMNNVRIYRDNGTTPNALDATDTLYSDAGTFGDVAADGTLNILVVADTPGTVTDAQTSDYNLIATTVNAGSTTVTAQTAGANTAGVDVVFADIAGTASGDGAKDGKHSASGRYTASSISVSVAKAVFIYSDPSTGINNGTAGSNYTDCTVCPKAIPTATLRYTITVTLAGSGTALNVVITDPIPTNTTYTAGTLKLNGTTLSDSTDGDAGGVGGTPVTATVNLGNLTTASGVQTITFDVTIN